MSVTVKQLERLAVEAHRRGATWSNFWPTIAADVAQAVRGDYLARGKLVHRLVGLVAAGDCDGQQPVDAGYGRPMEFELEQVK